MIFQKISCENVPKRRVKVLTTKCKKACILQEPYAKIPQNHSFFFKMLETNICSCYTIQTELSSDIHHFLYRNEDFYL